MVYPMKDDLMAWSESRSNEVCGEALGLKALSSLVLGLVRSGFEPGPPDLIIFVCSLNLQEDAIL